MERTPDHTALVGQIPNPKPQIPNKVASFEQILNALGVGHLSYKELNRKANQLAHLLRSKGVETNSIVGIMTERSMEMLLGIFAILKAGGAYMPIEPGNPAERLNLMVKDSQLQWLLTHKELRTDIPDTCEILDLSDAKLYTGQGENLEDVNGSTPLAYVIYTSGSTGKPKGVIVEQPSVINTLMALQDQYPLLETDVYLFKTSYVFDVSVTELLGWFFEGGRLAVLESGGEKDPARILDTIAKQGVTHINFVPSMFNVFVESLSPKNVGQLSPLKYIFLAGEAIMPEHLRKILQKDTGIILENIYGPTEATIYASWYSLSQWDGNSAVPIGKPLTNVRLYILGQDNALQPIGIPGELCISGAGIARGYLNRPELTAEKFCLQRPGGTLFGKNRPPWPPPQKLLIKKVTGKNYMQSCNHAAMQLSPHHSPQYPITPLPHYPIYLTGDLARWMPDGNIEFIGRIDNQVKVRGFRVELGEIENKLLKHDHIKEVVVTTGEMHIPGEMKVAGDVYLCAYFVSDRQMTVPDLKEFLFMQLPDYMVPAYFVQMEKTPLTPSGKVDRKALPSPLADGSRPQLGVNYVAPSTGKEKIIADVWMEVLKLDKIGIYDNFFDIGGNSLRLIQVNYKLSEALYRDIPMVKMFEYPTIHTFLNYLSRDENEGDGMEKEIEQLDIKHDNALNILEQTLQSIREEEQ